MCEDLTMQNKEAELEYLHWFDADVKPVHIGVYQVSVPPFEFNFYSFWNGRYWCSNRLSVREAELTRHDKSSYQDFGFKWRGVKQTKPTLDELAQDCLALIQQNMREQGYKVCRDWPEKTIKTEIEHYILLSDAY